MEPRRILAGHTPGKVHLRMVVPSLRHIFGVAPDGSFDTLLRQLDELDSKAEINRPEPTPRP